MPAESWPCGATTTTTSGRIPHWAIGVQQKRAGRLSNLRAPRPARLPNPKPTTINPKDSRYERGTNGGQVTFEKQIEQLVDRIVDSESSTAVAAYERRIAALERDKLAADEKLANGPGPRRTFEEMFELAMAFLANPWKLW